MKTGDFTNFLWMLSLSLFAGTVLAQPATLARPNEKPAAFAVRKASSTSEREALWKNTTRSTAGDYIVVDMDASYIGVIDRLRLLATPTPVASVVQKYASYLASDFLKQNYTAELVESAERVTLFFNIGGQSAMLTTWNFLAAGASIEAIEEFQNVQIQGNPGNIALVRSSGVAKVIWKLTWVAGPRQFEFYMSEANGQSMMSAQIVSLAKSIFVK